MIFKVYYQENINDIPVRENTKTLFVQADSERDVRRKLEDLSYNIEFITPIEGAYLEYEKKHNPNYKVLEISDL
ncbi:MAG: DNA-dependent RNA polymerase auxiliary subunit epsilon family protein [Bacillales bacterium]